MPKLPEALPVFNELADLLYRDVDARGIRPGLCRVIGGVMRWAHSCEPKAGEVRPAFPLALNVESCHDLGV